MSLWKRSWCVGVIYGVMGPRQLTTWLRDPALHTPPDPGEESAQPASGNWGVERGRAIIPVAWQRAFINWRILLVCNVCMTRCHSMHSQELFVKFLFPPIVAWLISMGFKYFGAEHNQCGRCVTKWLYCWQSNSYNSSTGVLIQTWKNSYFFFIKANRKDTMAYRTGRSGILEQIYVKMQQYTKIKSSQYVQSMDEWITQSFVTQN